MDLKEAFPLVMTGTEAAGGRDPAATMVSPLFRRVLFSRCLGALGMTLLTYVRRRQQSASP